MSFLIKGTRFKHIFVDHLGVPMLRMINNEIYWLQFNKLLLFFKITMLRALVTMLAVLLIGASCQLAVNQSSYTTPCIAFQSGSCTTCPYNYHMFQNQCFLNITGCQQYSTNTSGYLQCTACDPAISVFDGNGGCQLTVSLQQLANSGYLQDVAANYGDLRFQPISIAAALANPFFIIVNNFMLTGQYKHFISNTVQPLESVGTFRLGSTEQFKILYSGSGGGLMLCLISIDTVNNNAIILSSFVSIGITNMVSNCNQYSMTIQCIQCKDGYHLENGACYTNIENCVSYSRNICLQCSGFSYLIENRCVTSCPQTADLAQMAYFGDFRYFTSITVITITRTYLLL